MVIPRIIGSEVVIIRTKRTGLRGHITTIYESDGKRPVFVVRHDDDRNEYLYDESELLSMDEEIVKALYGGDESMA